MTGMGCLCCGSPAEVGELCRRCALEVAPCEGLIADHLRGNVAPTEAAAWLVDGFGSAHPISAKTTIGRSHDGEMVVLASSVSREHARLEQVDRGWVVRDLGSRNGTFVDGVRCQGKVTLPARAQLKVGDVAMWFLGEVVHEPVMQPSLATGSAAGGIVRYSFSVADRELCLVGSTDATTGGSLLAREAGASWVEHGLAPLEFQLLRALAAKAAEEAKSPSVVRGCVATRQLARDLPFQSKYANEENVRQVVRRVRGVLAVAPGRGYYLSCSVTTGLSDRS